MLKTSAHVYSLGREGCQCSNQNADEGHWTARCLHSVCRHRPSSTAALRFGHEPWPERISYGPRRVPGMRVGQDLQRHVAAQLCIPRAIDLAHPACAQGSDDLVGAEATAWGEGHGLRGRIIAGAS